MNLPRLLIAALLCTNMTTTYAVKGQLSLHVVPEYRTTYDDGLFTIPAPFHKASPRRSQHWLEMSLQHRGWAASATASQLATEGETPQNTFTLNELYLDAEWLQQDITVGKKISSWGVGYGFRPLDLIQKESRRTLISSPLEGVPQLAWHYYDQNQAALTLTYSNALTGKLGNDAVESSVTARYQTLWHDHDLYALARSSKTHRAELGFGASTVWGDQWEFHGSLLYRKRDEQWRADPQYLVHLQPISHSGQALIGASWAHPSGVSVIGEFWYDPTALSHTEWTRLRKSIEALKTAALYTPALYAQLSATQALFEHANVLQQNVFLRFSYDAHDWQSELEILATPEDRGTVTTVSLSKDGNYHHIEGGLRLFGGAHNSVYNNLPERKTIYLAWRWSLLP